MAMSYIPPQCETYSLTKETLPVSGSTPTKGTPAPPTLPLWGQFCCRLMAQPECATTIRVNGFINVQVNNSCVAVQSIFVQNKMCI